MICHHKVRKVYRIRLFDSDIANITFDTTQAPNQISIRPDLLSKAIQYLQTESEIIMKVFPSTLSIENIPAEGEVRTVSNLSTADVDDISISSATSLRFLTSVFTKQHINCRACWSSSISCIFKISKWFSYNSAMEEVFCV